MAEIPASARPKRKPGPSTPPNWKVRYVELIREHGHFHRTARMVGVDPSTAYRERDLDPEFERQCQDARQEYADQIEHRMIESAEASGNPAGFIVRLKALRPAEYIEKHAMLTLTADLNELPVSDAASLLRAMLGSTTDSTKSMLGDGTSAG
mgnify:CR=1 FL=1